MDVLCISVSSGVSRSRVEDIARLLTFARAPRYHALALTGKSSLRILLVVGGHLAGHPVRESRQDLSREAASRGRPRTRPDGGAWGVLRAAWPERRRQDLHDRN